MSIELETARALGYIEMVGCPIDELRRELDKRYPPKPKVVKRSNDKLARLKLWLARKVIA